MENQTYLQLLKDAFQFLFEEYNYKVVHHVAVEPFWNAQTYLRSDDLVLQIVNDWCQISLDLRPYDTNIPLKKQFSDFYDFTLVLELLEIPELQDLEDLYVKVLDEMFCEAMIFAASATLMSRCTTATSRLMISEISLHIP